MPRVALGAAYSNDLMVTTAPGHDPGTAAVQRRCRCATCYSQVCAINEVRKCALAERKRATAVQVRPAHPSSSAATRVFLMEARYSHVKDCTQVYLFVRKSGAAMRSTFLSSVAEAIGRSRVESSEHRSHTQTHSPSEHL